MQDLIFEKKINRAAETRKMVQEIRETSKKMAQQRALKLQPKVDEFIGYHNGQIAQYLPDAYPYFHSKSILDLIEQFEIFTLAKKQLGQI